MATALDHMDRHQSSSGPHQAVEGGNFVQVSVALNCLGELEKWKEAKQVLSLEELEECSADPVQNGRTWSKHQFSSLGSK